MEAPPKPTDIDDAIDKAIISYHTRDTGGGYVSAAVHRNVTSFEKDDNYTVYAHILYLSYGVMDGVYTTMSGASGPASIRLKKEEDGSFSVLDYKDGLELKGEPMPDDFNGEKQMWNDLMSDKYGEGLNEQADEKLREYLKYNGIDAKADGDYYRETLDYDSIYDYFPDLAKDILSAGNFWQYPEYQGTKRVIRDGKRVTLSTEFYISDKPEEASRIVYTAADDAGAALESHIVYIHNGIFDIQDGGNLL